MPSKTHSFANLGKSNNRATPYWLDVAERNLGKVVRNTTLAAHEESAEMVKLSLANYCTFEQRYPV